MKATTIWAGVLTLLAVAPAAAQTEVYPSPPTEDIIGEAADLPSRFRPKLDEWEKARGSEAQCPKIYEDPRDGTTLKLVRSVASIITTEEADRSITRKMVYGDYWIPQTNRYGLELGRALRIDCVANIGIGVVERFPDKAQ